ncbi:hypothetical protein ACYPKM_01090 [Pseudomonas aeruginosa]
MPIQIDDIQAGRTYAFEGAAKRVERIVIVGGMSKVHWEYADGFKRNGAVDGLADAEMFAATTLGEVPQFSATENTHLLVSRVTVERLNDPVQYGFQTNCPQKWALVDLVNGDVYKSKDGETFTRQGLETVKEISSILHTTGLMLADESART